ncbi:5'-deoxynucleotidase HDDC2-like [Daphnia pulicaria]|uniref:5'-deoxynucleotidase HDDC2-like n=1 Tax=Daphnia pulicaria TaxID=35523 RepID=UPI001EEBD2B2|nr:5'-deoxynucleotidase HDDC2-like [Daphnia pulicaria]
MTAVNSKVLEFCQFMGRLKHLPRTGWVIRDIPNCETVAGHMYRMAMLTFLLETKDVDIQRCLKMCLVHDMAESIVGDLTPHCGVSVEDKHRQEEEAMETLIKLVPELSGEDMKSLFMEYENQETQEAILVKDLDRFDMICQAYEYEEFHKTPLALQEFFVATEGRFKHPEVKRWVDELNQKRALLTAPVANGEADKPLNS